MSVIAMQQIVIVKNIKFYDKFMHPYLCHIDYFVPTIFDFEMMLIEIARYFNDR